MLLSHRNLILTCLTFFFLFSPVQADKASEIYLKKVKPLFAQRCVMCHGPLEQEGGVRVDAGQFLLHPEERDPLVKPGNSAESLLVDVLLGRNDALEMPMEGAPLTEQEKKAIIDWIDAGATYPDDEVALTSPREHWSFVPPVRPEVPEVNDSGWPENPIDKFIYQQYEKQGLQPVADLDRRLWLRRVYLDLIGLPPTADEVARFIADESPTANETVIDELLASPEHGERWGRHWMDVWRYSDWYGYRAELRNSGRHMWRWRDWIVDSVNSGKPYSDMMMEMVAGDELHPGDMDTARATGFLVRNYFKFNRNTWMENTVEHTSKAFLGVTMNCARCHDHMYDPISQKDYFQFRAIFEPHHVRIDRLEETADTVKDGVSLVYDADLEAPTYLFERGSEDKPVKDDPLGPGLPGLFEDLANFEVEAIDLPPEAFYPGFRPEIREHIFLEAKAGVNQARQGYEKFLGDEKAKLPEASAELHDQSHQQRVKARELKLAAHQAVAEADIARYSKIPAANLAELQQKAVQNQRDVAVAEAELALLDARVKQDLAERSEEKDAGKKKSAIDKAAKTVESSTKALAELNAKELAADYEPLTETYPKTSSGRRLAFARWLADRNNPLTARIAVNQLWMRHFGEPLVETTFDFGLNGKPSSHPELLDWLAVELMENGWQLKHIHRLMTTSHLYRIQANVSGHESNLAQDQDNHYLWRMNRRRAEAEVVRDSVLAVTDQLNRTLQGPELDAELGETTYRRSVYYRHAPEKMMPFMEVFDAANTNECYRRAVTIIPQQALALANSRLSVELSRKYAGKITDASEEREAFIQELFENLLSRKPSAEEMEVCLRFLNDQSGLLTEPASLSKIEGGPEPSVPASSNQEMRARENLVHVLFNHNEFVFIP
ncbi:Planctomycete cytochrome C [Polystyrenella longa]|uniref:Planctomycete cytochrome C n=1 Tax=Polystyrenella longa TaxID=2528007 RepID=A0A518CRY6_9PLAN|nr:DUF1553 domain-containing protein [Polystyrenella longa]QDU81991.1 Planctomycete cytochrome C [Polystyrenella longa]